MIPAVYRTLSCQMGRKVTQRANPLRECSTFADVNYKL